MNTKTAPKPGDMVRVMSASGSKTIGIGKLLNTDAAAGVGNDSVPMGVVQLPKTKYMVALSRIKPL